MKGPNIGEHAEDAIEAEIGELYDFEPGEDDPERGEDDGSEDGFMRGE